MDARAPARVAMAKKPSTKKAKPVSKTARRRGTKETVSAHLIKVEPAGPNYKLPIIHIPPPPSGVRLRDIDWTGALGPTGPIGPSGGPGALDPVPTVNPVRFRDGDDVRFRRNSPHWRSNDEEGVVG